jgi:hypothetical protein
MVREQTPTIPPPTRPAPHGHHVPARRSAARVRPLTLRERLLVRLKAPGLRALLADLERRHGPAPDDVRRRAERAWRGD